MPRYKVVGEVRVSRIYYVEAKTAYDAMTKVDEGEIDEPNFEQEGDMETYYPDIREIPADFKE